MCRDCHSIRDVISYRNDSSSRGSHPVDPNDGMDCRTCHLVHNAYAGGDYPEGDGYLLHGTLYSNLLGEPVTHGCIRLGDADLALAYRTAKVGTWVYIY